MKKSDLIKVADELNTVIPFDDPIDTGLSLHDLKEQVKQASLWLFATDDLTDETAEILQKLDWVDDDFANLKEDQDPFPAFYRYNIIPKPEEEEEKGEAPEEPAPEKPKAQKKKTTKPKAQKKPKKEPEPDPEPTPESVEEAEEYVDRAPPKPKKKPKTEPSAYGTALALMGENPETTYPDLCDRMRELGFDIQAKTGTIKTARSIARKMWRYYEKHGYIKEEFQSKA